MSGTFLDFSIVYYILIYPFLCLLNSNLKAGKDIYDDTDWLERSTSRKFVSQQSPYPPFPPIFVWLFSSLATPRSTYPFTVYYSTISSQGRPTYYLSIVCLRQDLDYYVTIIRLPGLAQRK